MTRISGMKTKRSRMDSPPGGRRAGAARRAAAAFAVFGYAMLAAAPAATISFSSTFGDEFYQSDGTTALPLSGFQFELGAFASGFTPTAANTGDWLANWSPVVDAAGDPLPEATAPFQEVPSFFGPYPAFNSEVDLTHNNAPFIAGTQAYIWGYDTRTEAGDAQWILMTNSISWRYPNTSGISLGDSWEVTNSNYAETLVGTVVDNGGPAIVTLGDVVIPGGVPEPGASVLAFVGGAMFAAWRRRPANSRSVAAC